MQREAEGDEPKPYHSDEPIPEGTRIPDEDIEVTEEPLDTDESRELKPYSSDEPIPEGTPIPEGDIEVTYEELPAEAEGAREGAAEAPERVAEQVIERAEAAAAETEAAVEAGRERVQAHATEMGEEPPQADIDRILALHEKPKGLVERLKDKLAVFRAGRAEQRAAREVQAKRQREEKEFDEAIEGRVKEFQAGEAERQTKIAAELEKAALKRERAEKGAEWTEMKAEALRESAAQAAAENRVEAIGEEAQFLTDLAARIDQAIGDKDAAYLAQAVETLTLYTTEEIDRLISEPLERGERALFRKVLKGKAEMPTSADVFLSRLIGETHRARAALSEIKPEAVPVVAPPELAPAAPAAAAEAAPAAEAPQAAAPEAEAAAVFEMQPKLTLGLELIKATEVAHIEDRLREIDRLAGSHDAREQAGTNMKKLEEEAARLLEERGRLNRNVISKEAVNVALQIIDTQLTTRADERKAEVRRIEARLPEIDALAGSYEAREKAGVTQKKLEEEANKLLEQRKALGAPGDAERALAAERKGLTDYLEAPEVELIPTAGQMAEKAAETKPEAEAAIGVALAAAAVEAIAEREKAFTEARAKHIELRAEIAYLKERAAKKQATPADDARRFELERELDALNFYGKSPGRTSREDREVIAREIQARLAELRRQKGAAEQRAA